MRKVVEDGVDVERECPVALLLAVIFRLMSSIVLCWESTSYSTVSYPVSDGCRSIHTIISLANWSAHLGWFCFIYVKSEWRGIILTVISEARR